MECVNGSIVRLHGGAVKANAAKAKAAGETGVSGNAFEMFFHGDFLFTKSKGEINAN